MRKKVGVFAFSLAMALESISMVYAQDIDLTLVTEYDENTVIQGTVPDTNVWRVDGYPKGSYLMSVDGTALTEAEYSDRMDGAYGYVIVSSQEQDVNTSGLLDQSGVEVMPLQYGEVTIIGSRWAAGLVFEEATAEEYDYRGVWSDSYWSIKQVDIYYLPEAKCVASLDRSAYDTARSYEDKIKIQKRDSTVNIYDSQFNLLAENLDSSMYYTNEGFTYNAFRDQGNGLFGLADLAGNVVIEPNYQSISVEFIHGYCEVAKDGYYGLVTTDGTVAVPLQYDSVENYQYETAGEDGPQRYFAFGYAAVQLDGKLKYVDAAGNLTGDFQYSSVTSQGVSALVESNTGGYKLIAADGVETALDDYSYVNVVANSRGMYYQVQITDENYNTQYGLIDWHGNEIVPCEYERMMVTGDAQYVLVGESNISGPYSVYKLPYPDDDAAETNTVPTGSEDSSQEESVSEGQNTPGELPAEPQSGESQDGFISFE